MSKIYIGVDNGISGTWAIIKPDKTLFFKAPIRKELSYTKKKQNISRLEFLKAHEIFCDELGGQQCKAILERPMINSTRFKASISAARCLEATLILLEMCEIPYAYCDSKQWQKEMLPQGVIGTPELKRASKDIGIRTFPEHSELIQKHGDADGLLIAEWARKNNL